MSMKKWTDEELISTRDNLETWNEQSGKSNSKLWLFTALLGAFAISTGIVFMFFDGVDVLSILLIIMGFVTCISWYRSERRIKDNKIFLEEVNKEIKSRKIKDSKKSKSTISHQEEDSGETAASVGATEIKSDEDIKDTAVK